MVKTVAFIPLRGGSKSIPLKNIRMLAGKPLAQWAIDAALGTNQIDAVYVATDSEEIRSALKNTNPKFHVISRSAETATDAASTESALLEFANHHEFESVVLIQATSPLLTAEMLSEGLELFKKGGFDSLLSGVRQKRFVWRQEADGSASPVNYDFKRRPRRQDFDGFLVENGAFYVTSRKALLQTSCRLSGRVGFYEMPEESYFEIDEPSDWNIVEGLLQRQGR